MKKMIALLLGLMFTSTVLAGCPTATTDDDDSSAMDDDDSAS
jgi:Phr family secreted Rap phosphatase inhibitor